MNGNEKRPGLPRYRWEATSIEGFVQQLAVSYLSHGYYFYVTGVVPARKDPAAVDRKLLEKYGVVMSKWARARRKAAGLANVHYLRHERFWVLLASRGQGHLFFDEEPFLDARERPVKFASYAISLRRWEARGRYVAHVGIERGSYLELKAHLEDLAVHRSRETLERIFRRLPFEPYAPVRRQLVTLLNRVNARRKVAGFELLDSSCLRLRRRVVRPFDRSPALDLG